MRYFRRFAGIVAIAPLLASLGLACILWVAAFGLAADFPFAYALVGFAAWALANHCVEIIEHKSVGTANWPTISLDTIAAARQQIGLLLLALVALIAAAYGLLARLGWPDFGAVVAGAAAVCVPAVAALLAVTRSPMRAFDPRAVAAAIARLGLDYVLCVLAGGGAAALILVAERRRDFVALFGAPLAVLVAAYMIGAIVYDRRLVLGVYAPRSPEARLEAQLQRLLTTRRGVLTHAYGIAASGSVGKALAHVDNYVRSESDPLAARVWMFHEIARWQDPAAALAFGKALAAELESADRADEAAKIGVVCRYLEEKSRSR